MATSTDLCRRLGFLIEGVFRFSSDSIERLLHLEHRELGSCCRVLMLPMPFKSARVRIVIDLAKKGRLPSTYVDTYLTDPGGLMSHGPNVPDLFRRAAGYLDRILKGARPADLPVELPSRFELVANLRTAKALGRPSARSALTHADQVIE